MTPVSRPRRLAAALFLALAVALPARAQAPDRSTPPPLGPVAELTLPEVQRFTLSNGLPVVLMEKHEVPLVSLTLVVDAGRVRESAHGLAAATFDLMPEGAGPYDALELADAVDYLGADLSTDAGLHTATVSLRTPLSKLDAALALMADVVLRPAFDPEELERYRREQLTGLVQAHDEPGALASITFDRALYGPDHPYGQPADLAGPLRALRTDDLRAFHDRHVRPNNATLVVVGDVTPASIQARLETAFGGWEAADVPPAPEVTTPEQVAARRIVLVDDPGAAQSVIRIGRIGAERATDDYFTLEVLNTVLGGSFTSRLNQNLREDKGYSYGAFSSFAFRPVAGPFVASASVQTDVTAPAVAEFMKELTGIRAPIPADEFERARSYVALRYPTAFQTVAGTAARLADVVAYGLPDDYLGSYTARLLAVTGDDATTAAEAYIDPERVVIVVVGDREKVEAPLRALGLGPVEVLSSEDVLGPVPEVE